MGLLYSLLIKGGKENYDEGLSEYIFCLDTSGKAGGVLLSLKIVCKVSQKQKK